MNYQDACDWLGLDPFAVINETQAKKAFRQKALREHPDKSCHEDATQRFQQIQDAYALVLQQVEVGATGESADMEATMDVSDNDGNGYEHDDTGVGGDSFESFTALRKQLDEEYYDICEEFGIKNDADLLEAELFNLEYTTRFLEWLRRCQRKMDAFQERMNQAQFDEEKMKTSREQAMKEGRDFFESWEFKRLKEEAKSRGLNVRGLQRETVIELLIEDETKKRLRQELKEVAPLIYEWVEIHGLPVSSSSSTVSCLNGCKARAVDFYDGTCCYMLYGAYQLGWLDFLTGRSWLVSSYCFLRLHGIIYYRSVHRRNRGRKFQEEVPAASSYVWQAEDSSCQS